jgi:hypothetical protein
MENEDNPALVLSNVHNRTSARDVPMFGSMGPSMNTSSLVYALILGWLRKTATFIIDFNGTVTENLIYFR